MNKLAIHTFEGKAIRTVEILGEARFIAKDIAEALGYKNTRKAIIDHCRYATPIGSNNSLLLDPQTIIIPEPDVFRLMVKSKLPSAEEFEKLVFNDILPSIRKTGSYGISNMTPAELTLKIAEQQVGFEKNLASVGKEVIDIKSRVESLEKDKESFSKIQITKAVKDNDNAYSSVNTHYTSKGLKLSGGYSRAVSRTARLLCEKRGIEVKSVPRSDTVLSEVAAFPNYILNEVLAMKKFI